MSPRIWAVVLARTDVSAKSRLGPALAGPERARLALAMLTDVLAACVGAGLAGTVAVVDTPAGASVASAGGAVVVMDSGQGMNGAARAGLAAVHVWRAEAALVLPGDVPLAQPADVGSVLAAAAAKPAVVVVPDRRGDGTNALLLWPPGLIAPAFGSGSAARHLAAAASAGVAATSLAVPALGLDVDTPEDLAALLACRPHGATAAFLTQLSPWVFEPSG